MKSNILQYSIKGKTILFEGNNGVIKHNIPQDSMEKRLQELTRLPDSPPPPLPIDLVLLSPAVFTIYLSAACNMKCSYCFNGGGTMGSATQMMTLETTRHTVDFIEENLKQDRRKIGVNLFGGEPLINKKALLALLREMLRLRKAYPNRLRVILMTNGLIDDEHVFSLMKAGDPGFITCVSLDGGPKRHNAHRRLTNGGATWQTIYDTTTRLEKDGIPFSITSVVPPPYQYRETAQELVNLGYRIFEIKELIPYSYGENSCSDLFHGELSLWCDKYLEYNEFCLYHLVEERAILPVDRAAIIKDFGNAYRYPSQLACKLGVDKVGIGADGMIYPCESMVHQELALGSVKEGWDETKVKLFWDLILDQGQLKRDNPQCQECFAKQLCGGGCYAINWDRARRFDQIFEERCDFIREKIKIDLYFISELSLKRPDLVKSSMNGAQ